MDETLANPTTEESEEALAAQSLPSVEAVEAALAAMEAPWPDEHVQSLLRLTRCAHALGIKSFTELGRRMNYTTSTISKCLRGKYGASPLNMCAKADQFSALEERRMELGVEPIVSLSVTRQMATFFESARESSTVGLCWGESHVGKTEGAKLYAEGEPSTHYVRMPAGGATRLTLQHVLASMGKGRNKNFSDLRTAVMRGLGRNSLLIIDEFHQVRNAKHAIQKTTAETLREIHDVTKCGMVLIWTIEEEGLRPDEFFTGVLAQFERRGVLRLNVPRAPLPEDLSAIREAYKFPPLDKESAAYGELMAIAEGKGLGSLCKTLRMAAKLGKGKGEPLGWEHFLATVATNRLSATGEWRGVETKAAGAGKKKGGK